MTDKNQKNQNDKNKKIDKLAKDAIIQYRKNKSNIFLEAAIQDTADAFGVKETRKRLQYYLDVLEEFQ